ncbi:MAG: flagellar protein FlgJ [Halomonadaceae bacterium T82-2]|nr:MAG: flagellar protein FlgJ [Halomonadaceae bacterium T82-2]
MTVNNLGSQFALDLQGLQRLKHTARQNPQEGLKSAAKDFEAIFLRMMLKSMREATPQSGLLDSQQARFYTEMLDKQWAQELSGKGFGLAEKLVDQLQNSGMVPGGERAGEPLIAGIPRGTPRVLKSDASMAATASTARGHGFLDALDAQAASRAASRSGASAASPESQDTRPAHVASFVDTLRGPAQAAARQTGVPAELILAQAALETGWGRYEIPTAEGGNSHNLFGIKAGSQWRGETTDIVTTEYVDGRPEQRVDRFRVYDDYQAAFTDYARLIGDNPRYAGVVTATSGDQAARALQTGGYATDPHYADKLIAVMRSLRQPGGDAEAQAVARVGSQPASTTLDPFSLEQVPTRLF